MAILRGFWGRLGVWTARHRVPAVVGSIAFLGVLALGNIGSQPTFNFLTSFRDPTDSSNGYAILQQHFPAGTLAPTTVLIQFKGHTADAYQHLALTVALQKVPGVAKVQGPTRPDGNPPTVDPATTASGYIAGQTAQLADTLYYNQRDTFLIIPLVLVLVGIVLALLLRNLIAPLYLLGAVTLNFFAAIGVCSFFFQCIEGQDGFSYAIPLYTFIFLVALGADYTIFLMSRVREEARKQGLEKGVPYAVSRTGGVITSAGLILAGTFAVLTTLPLNILYQLGVCVAVGILLDTFVVRGLLMPGVVLLLGKWNRWPGKLEEGRTEVKKHSGELADAAAITGIMGD